MLHNVQGRTTRPPKPAQAGSFDLRVTERMVSILAVRLAATLAELTRELAQLETVRRELHEANAGGAA